MNFPSSFLKNMVSKKQIKSVFFQGRSFSFEEISDFKKRLKDELDQKK